MDTDQYVSNRETLVLIYETHNSRDDYRLYIYFIYLMKQLSFV